MLVPWWAHWKTIDTIATVALIFIYLIVLGLVFYVWRIRRQFQARERHFVFSPLAGDIMPAWQLMLYIAPLVLLVLFSIASYLVVNTLYGYNLYEVLVMFYIAAPPGVYISGIIVLIIVPLWALLLTFIAFFTRSSKTAT